MRKPRILYVCSRIPRDEYSGFNIRIVQTVKALSSIADVDVLGLDSDEVDPRSRQLFSPYADQMYSFSAGTFERANNLIRTLLGRTSIQQVLYTSKAAKRWVGENQHRYQAIYCHLVRTAMFAELFSGPKVIDMSDLISNTYRDMSKHGSILWRLIGRFDRERTVRLERTSTEEFDLVHLITDRDVQDLQRRNPNHSEKIKRSPIQIPRVHSIPKRTSSQPGKFAILFFGKLDYAPNVDAIRYFAQFVFPLVKQSIPTATFQIAGSSTSKQIDNVARNQGVELLGFVEDLNQTIVDSDIVVAPMRVGSGIQNKVLHAMNLAVPVVLSQLAHKGIGAQPGFNYVVCESATEYASAVVDLHANDEKRMSIGAHGRDFVVSNFDHSEEALGTVVDDVKQMIATIDQNTSP